jgi:hypothetical protein
MSKSKSTDRKAKHRESLIEKVRRAINRTASIRHDADEVMRGMLSTLITLDASCEMFNRRDESPADIAPAVLAFASFAPDDVLEELAEIADREFAWAIWWDERGYAESIGAVPERGYDYEAVRAEVV